MDIGNKIRIARESMGYSQEELAKFLGITARTLQNYEYNKSDVGISLLLKMTEVLKVDSDFFLKEDSLVRKKDSLVDSLVDKKGLVSQSSPQDSSAIVPQSKKMSSTIHSSPLPKASISPLGDAYMTTHSELYPILEGECDPSDLLMLPVFVNGRVSCGNGEPHNEGDIYFLPQSKSFLKTKFNLVSTGALGIIQAIGNSMHPTIDEGDLLLFQCDGSSVEGGIYIIELEGDYYVKRLIKRPSVKLLSDNPIYDPIELQGLQEIRIIGRVVGVISNLRL